MGWCSGTPIFDSVASYVISSDLTELRKFEVLRTLADAMEDEDWDCQSDSQYWDNEIVQRVMLALHPDWLEDSDKGLE